ncbi:LacI family transcriptional regulator [Actinomadura pelletieri DSM 43383]|uniref:LacI family transcriptional regulator n=1 Tax=Actinomadura pelletieri DSM 43383 TaxID=1120940 RepID=A0A495Q8R9_9ACTN|nr:LacI family DNA-binding transcriptional regulator [Actinomadura pelletieri]RKS67710.1 LacI family transcriptional regulator [Actinomadura pelletieri DSM 43383]
MADRNLVRLQDVAAHAGVSIATASRMLSDPDYGGRAGLRERVLAAAAELGYRANPHARALATSSSSSVGLVVHDVRDSYFALLSGGVMSVAEREDLLVNMVCTYRDPARELEYVKLLVHQRVRALILTGSAFRDTAHNAAMRAELRAYQESGGSVVSVTRGRDVGHLVQIDNAAAMRELAAAMVKLGHTSFGVIAGPLRLLTVRDRLQGLKQGLKDHGIVLRRDDIVYPDLSREGGQSAAQSLMSRRNPPRCVMAVADVLALGAMSWLRSAGIVVPDEVSVTGFGGLPAAIDAVPSLTTVEIPLERVGETAMDLALRPASPRHVVEIEGTLALRESAAPPA